jgi:hypothetical protein
MVGILKARIFPLMAESGKDLRNARQLAKNLIKFKSPVGFSIQGGAKSVRKAMQNGKEISVAVPSIIPLISITPCPVNTSTFMLAKSFGEYVDQLQKSEDGASANGTSASGAMTVTGIIPQDGTEGGDSLKISEIRAKKKKKKKNACGTNGECKCGGKCGGHSHDDSEAGDENVVSDILKALAQLFTENQ